MITNKTYLKHKKVLKLLSPDRRYIVYFLIVFISSSLVLLFELIISHSFTKTTRIMLDQHNTRVEEYRELADIEKATIAQLKEFSEADTTQSVILNQFLNSRKNAHDSYESARSLVQESKAILESQLAFVKTEYEALGIWSALLTIVFLVFSFYSFYRMDQLREEGTRTLEMIKDDREKTKEKFSSSIDDWKTKKEKWEEDINKAIASLDTKFEKKRESLDAIATAQKGYLDDEIFKLTRRIESDATIMKDSFNQKHSEFSNALNKVTATLSELQASLSETNKKSLAIGELQLGIESLKTTTDSLSRLIPDLERRITSLEKDKMSSDLFDLYYSQQKLGNSSQEDK